MQWLGKKGKKGKKVVGNAMSVYILTFLLSMFLASQLKKIRNLSTRSKALISMFPVLIITGLRYDVGTDYFSYMTVYNLFGAREDNEWLFKQLSIFIREYGGGYQVFIFITSFIFLYIVYITIWELSYDIELSIFLFMASTYYFASMNAIRQGIAIAISIYGFKYLKENRYINYIISIIIASLFHDTILLCLIIPFIKKIKINFNKSIFVLLLIFFFNDKIQELITILVGMWSSKHYGSLINTSAVDVGEIPILMVMMVFTLALYVKFYHYVDEEFNTYLSFMVLAVIMGIFTTWLPWGKRMMWNCMFVLILFIPKCFTYLKNTPSNMMLKFLMLSIFFILTYYSIGILYTHSCVPYQWIL